MTADGNDPPRAEGAGTEASPPAARIARALGDMPLYDEHETGEILRLTLRDYLEQVVEDDMTGGLTVDGILDRMAEVALRESRRG